MLELVALVLTNCLSSDLVVTAVGGVYHLNGESVQGQTYHLGRGGYRFVGSDEAHPLGFLGGLGDSDDFFSYASDETVYGFRTPVGYSVNVTHYASDIILEIKDPFASLSMHCFNHGFMGGEGIFVYNATCDEPDEYEGLSDGSIIAIVLCSVFFFIIVLAAFCICTEEMLGAGYSAVVLGK